MILSRDEVARIRNRIRLRESFTWEEVERLLEHSEEIRSQLLTAYNCGFSMPGPEASSPPVDAPASEGA